MVNISSYTKTVSGVHQGHNEEVVNFLDAKGGASEQYAIFNPVTNTMYVTGVKSGILNLHQRVRDLKWAQESFVDRQRQVQEYKEVGSSRWHRTLTAASLIFLAISVAALFAGIFTGNVPLVLGSLVGIAISYGVLGLLDVDGGGVADGLTDMIKYESAQERKFTSALAKRGREIEDTQKRIEEGRVYLLENSEPIASYLRSLDQKLHQSMLELQGEDLSVEDTKKLSELAGGRRGIRTALTNLESLSTLAAEL